MIKLKPLLEKIQQFNPSNINAEFNKVADICEGLGNHEFLKREFGVEAGFGLYLVYTEEWTKGKIGLNLSFEPEIKAYFTQLTDKFGMDHIVYTSYKSSRGGFFGREYIMIPISPFKTIWSPKVNDIYSNISQAIKKNEPVQPMIDSYVDDWPTQPTGEVLVDCDQYYLLNFKRFTDLYGWIASSRINANKQFHAPRPGKKADLLAVTTYSELAPFLNWYAEESKFDAPLNDRPR
jgi:hypothetical protein